MNKAMLNWNQAIEIFKDAGLSDATLRRRIADGVIDPIGKGRKHLYSEKQVRAAAVRRNKLSQATMYHPSGATDWVKPSDLRNLVTLDQLLYGKLTVESTITQYWWKKNPNACRILFNADNREEVWGCLSIVPVVTEQIAQNLASEKMPERDLTANLIANYEEGGEFDCYVPSAAIHPDHKASLPILINSVVDFFVEHYPRIRLRRLYAFAASESGMLLISYLFFAPRYDLGENVFELDLRRSNPSPFIKRYRRGIESKAA